MTSDDPRPPEVAPNLVVEFVAWATAARVLEDAGELGAVIESLDGMVDNGFVTIIRNSVGEPMVNVATLDGQVMMRTHIGNIRKITVL